jgi:response regulator NasT
MPRKPPPTADAPLRILLIDEGTRRAADMQRELAAHGHLVVGIVDAAPLIHDCVLRLTPDVVIVDSESPSRDTLEHLAAISKAHPRPVVVFAERDDAEPLQQALRAGVSAYVIAGLQPQRLLPVLKVAIARFEQERALRAQLESAETALADRRTIDRAKGLLMDKLALSEAQAHAHLRKLAMDRGCKLGTAAAQVLAAARLLDPPV